MPYYVYFEIGGKKLKMKVNGLTEDDAKAAVTKSIRFDKIEKLDGNTADAMSDILAGGEQLMDMLNLKGK